MLNPTERPPHRRWSATQLVTKTKQVGSATVYLAGLVKVAEAAIALWERVVG